MLVLTTVIHLVLLPAALAIDAETRPSCVNSDGSCRAAVGEIGLGTRDNVLLQTNFAAVKEHRVKTSSGSRKHVTTATPCDVSTVQRRRREATCSCRRRSSSDADLPEGQFCDPQGNTIISGTTTTTTERTTTTTTETACEVSPIQRRRRGGNMCSCRRRTSYMDLAEGQVCDGDRVVAITTTTTTPCVGDNCPIGWNATNETKGANLWCEVSAPPANWSDLRSCPSGSATTNVKVLTYNLFWWNLFERQGGGGAGQKIIDTSGAGNEYDIMGFQECKDIHLVLQQAQYSSEYSVIELVKEDRALGMAYLKSRWTPLAQGWEDVGEDQEWQYYGRRAIQWVRLQHTNGLVVFFVNHHGPLPVSTSGNCAGSAAAYNIMRIITQNAYKSDSVVLVGDFNAQPSSSRVGALSTYMHNIMTGSSMGGVDHIFSNCDTSAVVTSENVGSGGSDHDALSVVFSFSHAARKGKGGQGKAREGKGGQGRAAVESLPLTG